MHDDIPFPRVKCFSTHRERARPKKSIQWYLDNREWWSTIISGEYQSYYEKMYGKHRV